MKTKKTQSKLTTTSTILQQELHNTDAYEYIYNLILQVMFFYKNIYIRFLQQVKQQTQQCRGMKVSVFFFTQRS